MTLNWVLIVWTAAASASFTLAAMHLLIWLKNRTSWANLLFSLAALGAVVTACGELWMMRAATPAEFGTALRWTHVGMWVALLSLTGFVRLRLRAGRIWLAWTICALRTGLLAVNFLVGANLNYLEVTGLRHMRLLGQTVAAGVGVPNPWMLVGNLSVLLLAVFIADAAISAWRRGDRRLALTTGGSILFCLLSSLVQGVLVFWGLIHGPFTPSLFFVPAVVAMAYELSRDMLRAAQLAAHLEKSEAALRRSEWRYDQAAEAAGIGTWEWDLARDEIWTTERGRALLGLAPGQRLDAQSVADVIHPEDRGAVCETFMQSRDAGGTYQGECRVLLPGGGVRWVATRCRTDADAGGHPAVVRGVSFDVTERKWAQERFERLVERVPVGVIMIDPRGRITLANRQIEADFAYSHLELVGQPVGLLIGGPLHAAHEFGMERFSAELTDRSMADGVVVGRRKDGSDIPVQISLNPIQTSQGPEVVATIVNVTERLRAAQELAEQRNELAHLSRVSTLNELSGAIGHELNQPLQAILSNAQAAQWLLAAQTPNLDEIREILHDIVRDDRRAGEVIQALRTLLQERRHKVRIARRQ